MTSQPPGDIARTSRPDPVKRLGWFASSATPNQEAAQAAKLTVEQVKSTGRNRRDRVKPLKRIERYITAIFKLGRTEWMAKQGLRKTGEIEAQAASLKNTLSDHTRDMDRVWQSIMSLEKAHGTQDARFDQQMAHYQSGLAVLSRTLSDLTGRLDRLMMREGMAPAPVISVSDLPDGEGLSVFKDQFYNRLENRYRGTRAEITRRLRPYLPDVEAAVLRTGGKPVLDLGCGRGEWLELLSQAGIAGFGVDTNAVQIAEGQELGLDLRLADAIATLRDAETGSLSVISAHHLIEHLPFDTVVWITREACRVLAPGGILLFETPDTRNVLVGATTFHTDPTHLKPMPEQVMGVLFETAGFHPVEIRHLNAHERFDEFLAKPDMNDELAFLMFGPQDLCVLGIKPEKES